MKKTEYREGISRHESVELPAFVICSRVIVVQRFTVQSLSKGTLGLSSTRSDG